VLGGTFFSWKGKQLAVGVFFMLSLPAYAQDTLQENIQSLQKQTSELKAMLEEMKTEIIRSRTEATALRQELEAARQQLTAAARPQADETSVQKLEEEQQLLSAKIDEQYQTKVESASKYRVRLSGIVLANLFSNTNGVDNIDFPSAATLLYSPLYSRGSFGGTLRQSQFGLQVFGPEIKGARVSGDVQLDLAGGFPNTPDGTTFGLPRLRTGTVRMTWPRTTIVAGQDVPFFSPLSPTSVAALALPEFAYSGNLWTWIPQARIERRVDFGESSNVLVQAGILDPLTGEVPSSQFLRTPGAGEASRQPAYATRAAWTRNVSSHPLTAGIGAYYSRQAWGVHRNVDSWAGTADWTLPVGSRWELSGEFYRGRAIGGLGGGIGRSVGYSPPPFAQIKGLNSVGGWSQAKFRQTERLEWNGGFGEDTIFAKDLRNFPVFVQGYLDPSVARNQSAFGNFIYRPRSDVLFSLEYRYFRTFSVNGSSETADHINLGMGVLF
jgi:hypothetical protein